MELGDSKKHWEEFLARELGHSVSVQFGRARKTVISWKRTPQRKFSLRMNHFFAQAPSEIQTSVALWLRSGKRARKSLAQLDQWIDEQLKELGQRAPQTNRLETRGRHYDLKELARSLWDYFSFPTQKPGLTWSRTRALKKRQRSLRFGSYDASAHVVRVHPILDQSFVPEYFLKYILFHELLHAQLGIQRNGTRRVIHSREFRRREKLFPDYERAMAWEKQNFRKLIQFARAQPQNPRPSVFSLLQRFLPGIWD